MMLAAVTAHGVQNCQTRGNNCLQKNKSLRISIIRAFRGRIPKASWDGGSEFRHWESPQQRDHPHQELAGSPILETEFEGISEWESARECEFI